MAFRGRVILFTYSNSIMEIPEHCYDVFIVNFGADFTLFPVFPLLTLIKSMPTGISLLTSLDF